MDVVLISKLRSKKNYIAFIGFGICMIVFGASDSLRGVFSIVFQENYSLNTVQLSAIVTVSYIGNLIFLLCGGNLLDRFNKKIVFVATLLIWVTGAVLFTVGNNYVLLLLGMFLCTGASTLANTTINILVPAIFASAPGMVVNLLYFIQGIGTSGAQNISGRLPENISSWKAVNMVLLIISFVGISVILFCNLSGTVNTADVTPKKEKVSYKKIIKNPAFFYYIFVFGFYFIAEHGILNWFLLYASKGLNIESKNAAILLSVFFGGITVGRLIFAPLVQKIGVKKSVIGFGMVGTVIYVLGIAGGSTTVLLLSGSGLILAILYPTLVLMIQSYYDKSCIASATGVIISVATLFDIVFNMIFGKLIDAIGMKYAFYILPISMALFLIILILFQKKVKTA